MQKTLINRIVAFMTTLVSAAVLWSCVNEQYEISEERLDLNVTIFQEGLCLPLGSTEKIRLDSVINKLGIREEFEKYISASEGGEYSFTYRAEEPVDLSEDIKGIADLIDIDRVDFSRQVNFSLSEVDMSGISYTAGEPFGVEEKLDEMFAGFDVPKPEIAPVSFDIKSGIWSYAEKFAHIDFKLDMSEAENAAEEGRFTLATVPADMEVPEYLLSQQIAQQQLPLNDVAGYLGSSISINNAEETVDFDFNFDFKFPQEVKSVSGLHVKEGAQLKVTVQVENPCFTAGSVTPHVSLNLSSVFHLADAEGKVEDDRIDEDFVLGAEDGWKKDEIYYITEIALNDGDIVTDEDGYVWLKKNVTLQATVRLEENNLETTLVDLDNWLDMHPVDAEHPKARQVAIKVTIEAVDLHVDDATIELNPINVDMSEPESFDITIPHMAFPLEVQSVESVEFTEDSKIDFSLTADGLAELEGLDIQVSSIVVRFPDNLIVDGADENELTLPGGSLRTGISQQIKLNGIRIEDPDENTGVVPERISSVSVQLKGNVVGEVHTGKLPTTEDDDLVLKGLVNTSVDIADYALAIDGYGFDFDTEADKIQPQEIAIEIPEELADMQGLKVSFENDPEIRIDINIPDITTEIRPMGQKGLVVKFPEMIRFKDGDYKDWWDDTQYALVFPSDKDFPEEIVIPIDYLDIKPQLDPEGKYYVKGVFEVEGAVGIEDGAILTKTDVDKLAQPGSGISFLAHIPDLVPSTASVGTYTSDKIKETVTFAPLKDVDIPAELASVGQITLDDVYLTLVVKTGEGFPSIGEDASLTMGLKVGLPEFMDIEDSRYVDGELSVSSELVKSADGGMEMTIDPIKLRGLNLNMTNADLKAFEDNLTITGNLSLRGASIVLEDWLDKTHSIDVQAQLGTFKNGEATDNLQISKVTGKVDYQLEDISTKVDLSEISGLLSGDNLSATIDIETFYVAVDVTTNLGIPVKADLSVIPYYGKEEGTPLVRSLALEPSASAAETKTTRIWLSDVAPDDSQGVDKFIEVDIVSLLYKDEAKSQILDSIKVAVNAGTDAEKTCVFEPSADYVLTVDYSAGIPLAFGEDFELVYRDTLALPSEAAMLMEYGSLALGGEIESSIPVAFDMTVRLLDSDNQQINISNDAIGMRINSCDADGAPVKTTLDLELRNYNKADISDLAAVELTFKADTRQAPGIPLREDCYIKAILHALIPEGVTLDAAEFLSRDDEAGEENADNE